MSAPTFSIIMPVRNCAATIEKAILSLLNQSYQQFELIIIDGGSTDGTLQIIKQYESRLAYWQSSADKGAADATNVGIKKARGDLIALLMADDWYEPEVLAHIASAYQMHPKSEMFTCGGRVVQAENNKLIDRIRFNKAEQLTLNLRNICFGTSAICCRFIKRDFYERIGLFLAEDHEGQQFLTNDKEFLLRAYFQGVTNLYVPVIGYTYLAHAASFSFSKQRAVSVKHCLEHTTIALMFLQKDNLTFKQKLFFRFWQQNQSAHLFLHYLIARQYLKAYSLLKTAFPRFILSWPFIFAGTTAWLCLKVSLRKLLFKKM